MPSSGLIIRIVLLARNYIWDCVLLGYVFALSYWHDIIFAHYLIILFDY